MTPSEKNPSPETMIGTITLLDTSRKVGVISLKQASLSSSAHGPEAVAIPSDLFFEMQDADLRRLRQGQLVQFDAVKQGEDWLVRDIQVLSTLS